jgi:membrane-associated phospholipid phosphatase
MRTPEVVALVYFLYHARGSVPEARPRRASALAVGIVLQAGMLERVWVQVTPLWFDLARDVWPLILLLAGYRLAGLFYDHPSTTLERCLLDMDRAIADQVSGLIPSRGAVVLRAWLELSYLVVYPLIPLGALAIGFVGSGDALDRFWTAVLAAGFACYGMLPWIQTRPPRSLEVGGVAPRGVRRLNLAILEGGSIGVNTLPSGHAATAVATALVVLSHHPLAGIAFSVVATGIAIATVVGRYHYTVDTALGVAVGILAWFLCGKGC